MIKFGTGGWRAVIGDDFVRTNIQKLAQGVCIYAEKQGKTEKPVMIGYDRRFLSDVSAAWLAEVLCANGIKVICTHRSTPTPMVMHTVKKRNLHFGLEVTASHNPSYYNGIKLIVHEGRDASAEETGEVEAIIEKLTDADVKRMTIAEAEKLGLLTYLENPFNDFIDDIIAQMDMKKIREQRLSRETESSSS